MISSLNLRIRRVIFDVYMFRCLCLNYHLVYTVYTVLTKLHYSRVKNENNIQIRTWWPTSARIRIPINITCSSIIKTLIKTRLWYYYCYSRIEKELGAHKKSFNTGFIGFLFRTTFDFDRPPLRYTLGGERVSAVQKYTLTHTHTMPSDTRRSIGRTRAARGIHV